jgi:hypothetical protein
MGAKIIENFLDKEDFKRLQEYCNQNTFEIINVGEKDFSVLETPNWLIRKLEMPKKELFLTFIRNAHKDFDTELRIHADNVINGRKTSTASVLYINEDEDISANGTAFYEHKVYGEELPRDISNEDFDKLLIEDSNDHEKWHLTSIVESKPNRMVRYNSNLFHSKYPKIVEHGVRIVLVCFYADK